MDPDACFSELLEFIADDDAEAHYHAQNLLQWLDRGGFAPGGGKLRQSAVVKFCKCVIATYPPEETLDDND